MNKKDIIDALFNENEISRKEAKNLVDLVFLKMTDALAQGDRVEIRGFGSFTVRNYKAYEGRNPKTGEVVRIKPKKLPFFKCGKDLKDKVNYK